jgi:hypothetical protein
LVSGLGLCPGQSNRHRDCGERLARRKKSAALLKQTLTGVAHVGSAGPPVKPVPEKVEDSIHKDNDGARSRDGEFAVLIDLVMTFPQPVNYWPAVRRVALQRVQTIIGTEPHIMVIGMPLLSIRVIMSQHILSMSMLIMPVGSIVQLMPLAVISHVIMGFMGMPQQLIIGMPEHIIMHGVPFFIMTFSVAHMSFNISMDMPAAGIIMHCMPLSVMVQVIWQDIGIIIAMGIDGAMLIGDIIDSWVGEAVFMADSCGRERDITERADIITVV